MSKYLYRKPFTVQEMLEYSRTYFTIHDAIAEQAIHNFILHCKKCDSCNVLYQDFINKKMNTKCFKRFFEGVLKAEAKYE